MKMKDEEIELLVEKEIEEQCWRKYSRREETDDQCDGEQ